PSLGLGWADLGGRPLTGLGVGQYSTLTFDLPSAVEAALEGNYQDLRLKVVLNAPALSGPYLLDNVDLAELGAGDGVSREELTVVVPQGETRESVFLSAAEHLQVADRVEIGQSGTLTNVASLGAAGSQFGAQLSAHANIYSVG